MADFFQTYFVEPMYTGEGYNIVNTATFAIILIIAVFFIYKLLKRLGIGIDKNFMIGVVPFIAMGGLLRSMEDLLEITAAKNIFLITPLIYVVVFAAALAALLIAKYAENLTKMKYWKVWFSIGAVLDIFAVSQLRFTSVFAFAAVIGIAAAWILAVLAGKRLLSKKTGFFTNENMFIVDVHMFDATTTFVALSYFPYFEQHVLPGFLINIMGPAAMFLLKIIVVPVVLYFFDKELSKKEDMEKRTFLKIVVLILGLGPGLRNFLRLVMGV